MDTTEPHQSSPSPPTPRSRIGPTPSPRRASRAGITAISSHSRPPAGPARCDAVRAAPCAARRSVRGRDSARGGVRCGRPLLQPVGRSIARPRVAPAGSHAPSGLGEGPGHRAGRGLPAFVLGKQCSPGAVPAQGARLRFSKGLGPSKEGGRGGLRFGVTWVGEALGLGRYGGARAPKTPGKLWFPGTVSPAWPGLRPPPSSSSLASPPTPPRPCEASVQVGVRMAALLLFFFSLKHMNEGVTRSICMCI